MMDWQTVMALRIETEQLHLAALEARRAAAAKEQEYKEALSKWIEATEKERTE